MFFIIMIFWLKSTVPINSEHRQMKMPVLQAYKLMICLANYLIVNCDQIISIYGA